jgi:hypothetical protein
MSNCATKIIWSFNIDINWNIHSTESSLYSASAVQGAPGYFHKCEWPNSYNTGTAIRLGLAVFRWVPKQCLAGRGFCDSRM